MNRSRIARIVLGTAILAGSALATIHSPAAHAGGGLAYGPDTCIQGYVWRDAGPNDHVCVTPATRDQAAYDNSQADARRDPNGGPYGPNTCLQGYVWREAFAGDYVCVTPDTRAQAAADNSQVEARKQINSMPHIWISDYTVGPVCNGDTCTSTSTDDIPRIQVNGDNFTIGGNVYISFRRISSGFLADHYTRTAGSYPGFALGSFGKKTHEFDCSSQASAPVNYTVQAYDYGTGTWSNSLPIKVCSAVL